MHSLEPSVKIYKRKFDRELRHIKLILANKRHELNINEWLDLVQETKQSIINSPNEFFCMELPSETIFHAALEKVFEGFLADQRLLAIQTPRPFDKIFAFRKARG